MKIVCFVFPMFVHLILNKLQMIIDKSINSIHSQCLRTFNDYRFIHKMSIIFRCVSFSLNSINQSIEKMDINLPKHVSVI